MLPRGCADDAMPMNTSTTSPDAASPSLDTQPPPTRYLLLYNCRQVVQIVNDAETSFLAGKEAMNNIRVLSAEELTKVTETIITSNFGQPPGGNHTPPPSYRLAVLCRDELIVGVGALAKVEAMIPTSTAAVLVERFDCEGGCVLPGLVDAHTHPVFAGDRSHEFAAKLAGATYMDIQLAGGGIHYTTAETRRASHAELSANFAAVAEEMLRSGTTLAEAKSGYGLDSASEMRMLEVLDEWARGGGPLELSVTFCGAHAVPAGGSEEGQVRWIEEEMLPRLAERKARGELRSLENIDVFCEHGVFSTHSTRQILTAGRSLCGLRANFHADELHAGMGGAELAAEVGAAAVSHLEECSLPGGVEALAAAGTVAVLLPTTAYVLRLRAPPARWMLDAGCVVALGSDFNPNAPCLAMPVVMHLACVLFGLSMPEALVAATLNAAHSLGRGRTHGAVAVGRRADLLVVGAPSWEHLIYRLGSHNALVAAVVKSGKVVYHNNNTRSNNK